jgi:arabinan endo-1,5-alpha-L-arabinosidase
MALLVVLVADGAWGMPRSAGQSASAVSPAPTRAELPHAVTRQVQAVTGVTATIRGIVRRARHPTTWWFQFGLTRRYGAHTGTQRAGPGRRVVTAVLAGLRPARRYHARLVPSTCAGCRRATVYGRDIAFTTAAYANPVWSATLAADPDVLDNGGAHHDYWAYLTGDGFPILRSSDLVRWRPAGTAFPRRPAWVRGGNWDPWAPNVTMTDGPCPGTASPHCYVMFYTGRSRQFAVNCIGVATATSPGGPYNDLGPLAGPAADAVGRPIGCGDNAGFALIDPSVFIDPAGSGAYLYVSASYICPAGSTSCGAHSGTLAPTISVIPLTSSLLAAAGPRTPLFAGQPGGWEAAGVSAPTVEAPAGLLHDGTYYVLFSGGSWRHAYGMGYATGPSPTGPFTQAAAPILAQTRAVFGPGGGDQPVLGPHGGLWLVYHGRRGTDTGPRWLWIDPFSWHPNPGGGPDIPAIAGPTGQPQADQP